MEKMVFSAGDYKLLNYDDPSFLVLQVDIMSDGENRNGSAFRFKDMKKRIPSLYNKPINCLIGWDDFEGHAWTEKEERNQVGIGTFPETNSVKFIDKNGRKFLRANALIWKYLYPEAVDILKKRKSVDVSMEIEPLETEMDEEGVILIKDWRFEAVTLLGEFHTPAIAGANAVVTKFETREKYFDHVLTQYSIAVDKIVPTHEVVQDIQEIISNQEVSRKAILEYAEKIDKNESFSRAELTSLYYLMNDKLKGATQQWFEKFIEQKEGGQKMNKVKEALMKIFADGKEYIAHTDEKVFCFNHSLLSYESYGFSVEEGDDVKVEVADKGNKVFKLKGKNEFVEEKEEGQEYDSFYSINVEKLSEELSTLRDTLKDYETKVEEKTEEIKTFESKVETLENEKQEMSDSLANFSKIKEELEKLREYKADKEADLKAKAIQNILAQYADFLEDKEVTKLTEEAEDLTVKAFQSKVESSVLPRMKAKLESLINKGNDEDDASATNLNYSSFPNNNEKEDENEKKPKTLLDKIKNL